MESLFDPVLKLVCFIWGSLSRQIDYARGLYRKVDTLKRDADELRRRHDDIQAQVQAAVSVGKTELRQVEIWLEDVDDILRDVGSIDSDFQQGGSCFNGCCPDLRLRLKLGKKVAKKIRVIEQLLQKGVFDNVAESPRRPQMPKFPVPSELEQQSTSQLTLLEIEQALFDEEIGIVSICGIGGVGKTTLMQEICNRLAGDFDVVIWVTASKDLNFEVIQKRIGKQLEMEFRDDEGIEDKRRRLHARLRNVRYMLILDDLWQKFSLNQIGIPQPSKENRCKIAITTRSVEVGYGMEADGRIMVKTLSSVEAWEFFRSKTGDVVLQPEIQTLAKAVVRECAGLPLAIKTVGGAMRRKGQKELWQNALRVLRIPTAPEVPGMEREVFLSLKLSYDSLEDPKIQSCFLYCSLYPEDYEIETGDLVRYWAFEEGLINNVSSLDDAINKGHGIIDRLKDACLLEEGPRGDRYVRMHVLLRDLAILITSPSMSSSSPFFLVKAGEGLVQPPEEKTWEGMERISLMRNQITELQMTPNCPDLVSLSLRENSRLHAIHNSFFQLLPKLQILDLQRTGIKSLPPSLSQLVNLRVLDASCCGYLEDVPPLGHLKELQFLDLCGTGIESLPQGIASLAKLRSLELSDTKVLATIPGDIISRLTLLENLGLQSSEQMVTMEIWREVATLRRLTNLRIVLPSLDAFSPNDMKHPMWSRLGRFHVQLTYYGERTLLISGWAELPILQKAFGGESPTGFQQLKRISISGCHKLRCIFSSSMLQNLHRLESLTVKNCKEIVEIVEGGPLPDSALQGLRYLILEKLPNLQRIYVSACQICISGCHKLRCIFSSSMLQHLHPLESLKVINCEEIVEIVEGGPFPNTALQRLDFMQLMILPKLRSVSLSASEISIYACHQLRCIFSSRMLQHLHPLESLIVHNCEEIVEIVEGGPLPDTALQRSSFLNLKNLPKLKSISISACDIYIFGCHKLRCIFSSSMLQHLQSLERLTVNNCEEIVEIVEGGPLPDTALQRLGDLSLNKLPKLERISVSACQISISACHKLRCIFSSSMLQHQHPLERLRVEDCEEIVEIVEGGPLPDTALQRLRYLRLEKLPKLKSISVSACDIYISGCHKLRCTFSSSMLQHLQSLERLTVNNCEEIFEIVEGSPLPDTALQRLGDLSLANLPKLTAICSQQLVLTSMKEIWMEDCPELKKLPVLCSGIQGWILASGEWWKGIEWEDQRSQSLYSTIYRQI